MTNSHEPGGPGNEKAAQLGSPGGLPTVFQKLGGSGYPQATKPVLDLQPRSSDGRYPETPGFKDKGAGRDAAQAYAPQAAGRRADVLAGLARLGGRGTAEQIGEEIGLHWYLVRPRLSELAALGQVIKTGERGLGALGGRVNVWRVTTPAERDAFAAGLADRSGRAA